MAAPIFLWYNSLQHRKRHVHPIILALFLTGLLVFMFKANINIDSSGGKQGVVGVYFYIMPNTGFADGLSYLTVFSISVFLILLGLEYHRSIRHIIEKISLGLVLGFFIIYFYHFLTSLFTYYFEEIAYLFGSRDIFILFYMIVFFMTSIGFYGYGIYQFFREL